MDAVTALATAPAVVAMVTLARDLGLPSRLASLAAVVLGVALSVTDYALAGTGIYASVSSGLVLSLGAAGLYDTARIIGRPVAGGVEQSAATAEPAAA